MAWSAREKGDRKWLKNYRIMLAHMRSNAEREDVEAESAVDEATRRLEMEGTNMNRARLESLKQKQRGTQSNLDWQRKKQNHLAQDGIVLLDKGEPPHELSEQEHQWNCEFQQMETDSAAASARSGTSASAPATAIAAVGAAAAASADPAMEIAVAAVEVPVPDGARTISSAGASASAAVGKAAAASAGPVVEIEFAPVEAPVPDAGATTQTAASAGAGKQLHQPEGLPQPAEAPTWPSPWS